MRKCTCLLMCLFLTFISSAAVAADVEQMDVDGQYYHSGDWELGFHGSYTYISVDVEDDSDSFDFFYVDIDAAYFVTDNVSVGASTVWFYIPDTDGVEAYALGLEANARYHFQVNTSFIPYVGVHIGDYYMNVEVDGDSESDDMLTYGAHVGFKVPINDNVYFDTQLKWTEYDMPVDDIDLAVTQVLLGLKIKL